MLTPIDIHYLVGLLTATSGPESAEVLLGAMVLDETTGTERDVDVTVVVRSGTVGPSGYSGIEVKAHGRPLDVAQVEQLCVKLKDMPSLSSRSVVSASGFTGPATKKAAAHGVGLLELAPLRPENFKDFSVQWGPPEIPFIEFALGWSSKPDVRYLPRRRLKDGERLALLTGQLVQADGTPHDAHALDLLSTRLVNQLLERTRDEPQIAALPPGRPLRVSQRVNIDAAPYVAVGGHLIAIDEAHITGEVSWTKRDLPFQYRGLFPVGESKPIVGCAFVESTVGHVLGFVLRREGGSPLISIPLADRNREKIYRQALRRAPETATTATRLVGTGPTPESASPPPTP